jgi:CMP-N-acetylneuraminic acid synthetase
MSRNILGVIPARGGSKRVTNKNIREVGGKPLIAHSIDQTENSEILNQIIISTEDDEIREVAESYGGNVPFERPQKLATDTASSSDVVLHALDWFRDRNETFDIVAMIQTTTPFRTPEDIDEALRKLMKSDADSVVSVSEFDVPPVWAVTKNDEGFLSSYIEEGYMWGDEVTRSQDTPTLYHPNGAIFAAHVPEFRYQGGFYTECTLGYEMPRRRSIDIDDPIDLEIARALFEVRN